MPLSTITPEQATEFAAILAQENTELRAENHALKVQRNLLIKQIEELTSKKEELS